MAADYVLGPGDRIRVTVYGEPDLSNEYTVRAGGPISMPLVGPLMAAGFTPTALELTISTRLASTYLVDPKVSVEIMAYGRFYILGDVKTPGAYSYQPDMTVLDAVALAGSFAVTETDSMQLRLNMVRADGAFELALGEYRAALARKARLLAERDGRKVVVFPTQLLQDQNVPAVAEMLDSQRRLFEIRRSTLSGQIQNIERQISQLKNEISALKAQVDLEVKVLNQTKADLDEVQALFKKGIVPKNRVSDMRQTAVRLETDKLDHIAAIERAKQRILSFHKTIYDLRSAREKQIIADLQAEGVRIAELNPRLNTVLEERAHAEVRAETARASISARKKGGFLIRRNVGKQIVELKATETTLIRPGDTIIIPVSGAVSNYSRRSPINVHVPNFAENPPKAATPALKIQ